VSSARAEGRGVVAVSTVGPVGVDIEVVTTAKFPDHVADVMLSPRELHLYAAASLSARPGWLGRAWVSKEALLKGLGCGLEIDPASIDVTPEPDGRRPTGTWRPVSPRPGWWLLELDWGDDVVAVASLPRPASLDFVELVADEPVASRR